MPELPSLVPQIGRLSFQKFFAHATQITAAPWCSSLSPQPKLPDDSRVRLSRPHMPTPTRPDSPHGRHGRVHVITHQFLRAACDLDVNTAQSTAIAFHGAN